MHEATRDYLRQIGRRGGKKGGRKTAKNREHMRQIGRKGGSVKSKAKKEAAKLRMHNRKMAMMEKEIRADDKRLNDLARHNKVELLNEAGQPVVMSIKQARREIEQATGEPIPSFLSSDEPPFMP